MSGYQRFEWRGEPIYNIEEWAKKRGDKMVYYRVTYNTIYGKYSEYGSMPETFWTTMLIGPDTYYEELERKECR